MALFQYLTFSLLIMVIGAPVAWLIGRKRGRYGGIFALAIMAISFFVFALAWYEMAFVSAFGTYEEVLLWIDPLYILTESASPFTFLFGFYLDGLNLPIVTIIFVLTTAATCYSIGYMAKSPGQSKFFAFLLLYNAGILGVVLATNLVQFYLFWELMLIPSYFLIAQWGTKPKSVTIALKYFIFTQIGAICILLGIAGIWSLSGAATLNIVQFYTIPGVPIINLVAAMANPVVLNLVKLLVVLLLVGFSIKMAIFPLHTWLPDAHAEAPTPISVILSGVMIGTGAYAVVRILITFMFDAFASLAFYLMIFAVVTMFYGGIMALAQKDTKRLFAYSSISQMGYIFFGLTSVTLAGAGLYGVTGAMFHIFTHALGKGLLFMTAGVLMMQVGHERGRDITAMGGLAKKMPWTTMIALIAAISIAGTPPLAGFASEWIIFAGGALAGSIVMIMFAVASTALTAGYVLWFIKRVFFGPTPTAMSRVKEPSWWVLAPMLGLAALIVIIGLWPGFVINRLFVAVQALLP